jgi:hypothetical protein
VDFFGNVQSVEVERTDADEPGSLKEDLVELARLVEKWRTISQNYATANNNSTQQESERALPAYEEKRRNVGPVKLSEETPWEKRLVGLSVLGACAAIWVAGSALGGTVS